MPSTVSRLIHYCKSPQCSERMSTLLDEVAHFRPRFIALQRELNFARMIAYFYKTQAALHTGAHVQLLGIVEGLRKQLEEIRALFPGLDEKTSTVAAVRTLREDLDWYVERADRQRPLAVVQDAA